MIVVNVPSFETVTQAMDWLAGRNVVRVILFRGPDGLVRGSALVRREAA